MREGGRERREKGERVRESKREKEREEGGYRAGNWHICKCALIRLSIKKIKPSRSLDFSIVYSCYQNYRDRI